MPGTVPAHGGLDHFQVVINDEEQYSIWRVGDAVPSGWRGVGVDGSQEDCLSYIDDVWTDLRPASLRRWMEADHSAGRG